MVIFAKGRAEAGAHTAIVNSAAAPMSGKRDIGSSPLCNRREESRHSEISSLRRFASHGGNSLTRLALVHVIIINSEMNMNRVLLVIAFAFVSSAAAAVALPVGSQPGMTNAGAEVVQIKQKKAKSDAKKMKGMKGMDHSKMKM